MEDHEIIELYWRRSERAITETDKKYGRYCYSISHNILHSPEDARECVNDTWWKAWSAMPPQRPQYLSTFLGKIIRNLSLNRFKQARAEKRGGGQTELALAELGECVPARQTVEQISEERELVESIERFLYAQSEEKRNLFVRRYWYLSAVREIAREYGMSESKVKSMLYRMRNELKCHLEQEGVVV